MTATAVVPHVIARETVDECWDDVLPLLVRHKDEIAHYDDIDLNVDRDAYIRLEQAGILRVYTVRAIEGGEIIGYEVVMVGPNIHYRTSVQARVDVLYIAPEHRRGYLGIKLIDHVDADLRASGVQVIYHHCKLSHPALGVVLKRLDYEAVETIWCKRLDR